MTAARHRAAGRRRRAPRRRPTAPPSRRRRPRHRRAPAPRSPRPARPTSTPPCAAAHAAFDDGRGAWPSTSATGAGPRAAAGWPSCCASGPRTSPPLEATGAGHPIGDARWEVERRGPHVFEYYAGAANKHLGSVVPVQDAGLGRRAARAGRGVRPDRAVELPAAHRLAGSSPRPSPAATRSSSSRRRSPRSPRCCSATCWSRPACPPRRSTSSPGPGRSSATRWSATPGSPRSASPARRPPAPTSCASGPTTSPGSSLELGGKSAAIVFADADVEQAAAATPDGRCSATPARTAAPAAASWSSAPSTTSSWPRFADAHPAHRGGRPARRRDRDGPDDLRRPAPDLARLPRDRRGRGRPAGLRRRGARAATGFYLSPAVVADVDNAHAHRPGGDLRAGRRRSSPSTTRTTPSASPTTATTACPARCGPASAARAIRVGPPAAHRHPVGQHEPLGALRDALRRLSSGPASAASSAWPPWTTTPRPARCSSPRRAEGPPPNPGGAQSRSAGGQDGSSWRRKRAQRSASSVSPMRAAARSRPWRARRKPRFSGWDQRT